MSRKNIVAGNWKMNCTKEEAVNLAQGIRSIDSKAELKVFVAPILISTVVDQLGHSPIEVGAQNMYYKDNGAYTGETSPTQLTSFDCHWVLVGHSERRSIFGEDDTLLKRKVDAALSHGIQPMFCFGETLEEREAGREEAVVRKQLEEAVFHLDETKIQQVVLAYEPVWAIGTGLAATPDQAQEMHQFIRNEIAKKYSPAIADSISILYGGSVKPNNAAEIFAKPDIDGGLIGGASLNPEDFKAIAQAF